jgi:hypothetical protein
MKKIILTLTVLFFVSCKGSSDAKNKEYNTPEEVGAGVYELYQAFFKDVATEIDGGSKDCSKIDPIASTYKNKIVELGKKREKMSDADKSKCDNAAKDKAYELYISQSEEYKKFGSFMDNIKSADSDCYQKMFDYISLNLYGNLENVKRSFPSEVDLYK